MLLIAYISAASAAPGQSGTVYPSAVPADHTVRVGIGGGFVWSFFNDTNDNSLNMHGLSAVDFGVQPVEGLQVSGAVTIQRDGRARPDPAFFVMTGTLPTKGHVKLALSSGMGFLDGRAHGVIGLLLGSRKGKVGWDLGIYPLRLEYQNDYGWAELEGGDKTPRWDLHAEGRLITAGFSYAMGKHWSVRVGFPDGVSFSLAHGHFWLDVGGASIYNLAGVMYFKAGFRI